jgi:hypothetical protein
LSITGALAGGIWGTGLAILARGTHPQFFVIGDDAWQLVLVEHGQRRALIGIGEFERPMDEQIARLTTSLRQHVDLVIGESSFLAHARTSTSKWNGAVRIQMDGSVIAPGSSRLVHLQDRITAGIGDFTLTLQRLPDGEWHRDRLGPPSWIAHLQIDNLIVGLAPSLDIAAEHVRPEVALAIAPEGDIARLQRLIPHAGIVTNPGSVPDAAATSAGEARTTLIRTFPADIASFRIRDGHIQLPDWTQHIGR